MKQNRLMLAALAGFAIGGLVATTSVNADTNGMERRDDRRDTRDESRDQKAACKAGDDSRAECRQEKRDTKQEGRGSDGGEAPAVPAAN